MPHHVPLTEKQIAARPSLQIWLLSICALIFIMVIVGGATRLTGSGLSITEWKPIMGAIPPLNLEDWQIAFDKYRQIPQYQEINKGMSLNEFKYIFWWEWGHRFLGRFIGFAFLLPFLFFLFSGRVENSLKPKLWVLFALGGLQGFVGWYMVASGLVERTDVSQYRLAMHLGLAIFIFAALFWVALGLTKEPPQTRAKPVPSYLKTGANSLLLLIFIQIIAGAFVAGLKAGMTYNTWPLMDGHLIPNGLLIMQPLWVNFFENVKTVQFDHRVLAYLLIAVATIHFILVIKSGLVDLRTSAAILIATLLIQLILGIMTLMMVVPLDLALLHQGGALIVLMAALWHRHQMREIRP